MTTAVANAVAERYVRLRAVPGSKCVVVTNGIEMAELQPNAQRRAAIREDMGVSDEFVWLSVGRITPAKDFPNLMQAFGQALRDFPKVQLWSVGDGTAGSGEAAYSSAVMPQRASIPGQKIRTWGTQVSSISSTTLEKVRWLGLRRDVPALLDAADGFVLSSAWEGMPLALGEAMAMEKPVVATDVGGVRELVGDAGVIVPAKDSGALAAAMLDVMKRPSEWRAATGRAARARIAESFSMDAKADQWEALYRSVAE